MKRLMAFYFVLIFLGCSYGSDKIRTLINEPETILRDPEYADYKESLDHLESDYLHKRISYAEYLEQKRQIEAGYDQEIKTRRDQIEGLR